MIVVAVGEVVVLSKSIQSKEKLTFNSCSFRSSALSGVSRLRTMVCSVRWSTDEGWKQESLTNHPSCIHTLHTYIQLYRRFSGLGADSDHSQSSHVNLLRELIHRNVGRSAHENLTCVCACVHTYIHSYKSIQHMHMHTIHT